MDIVIDTSAIIAVLMNESDRSKIIELSVGCDLIGPGCIPWEIGNAFSAMFKKGRITMNEAKKGIAIFESIPLRFVEPDIVNALKLAKQNHMYAYDAYFLDCSLRYKSPLLTLDRKLVSAARRNNIDVLEV